jgi:hypothetical protein
MKARDLIEIGWTVAIIFGIALIVRLAVRFRKDAIWLRGGRGLLILDRIEPLEVAPPTHE